MEMGTEAEEIEIERIEVESTWKGLFQRRVVMAETHCNTVHGLLRGMLEVVTADAGEWGRDPQPPCAEDALESAAMELGLALASMGAARHIALRGGAPSPAAPLESADDVAGDPDVWCALDRLEKAAALATGAHDRVERARGHLGAAALLRVLDDEEDGGGAPWEQSPCLSERLNGVMELREALSKAVDLVAATAAASEAAFGFRDGSLGLQDSVVRLMSP
ncbi:hypothetical protein EJB05_31381, partial [Eragrostis curvula]